MAKQNIDKILALPDLHYPENIDISSILSFCKDMGGFDYVILLGDNLDMAPVSRWIKDMRRKMEGKRLVEDYHGFQEDILDPLKEANPFATFVFMKGNHENWLQEYIDRFPSVEGMIEPEVNLHGIHEWIEFNHIFRIGELSFMHGVFTNKYHANKTTEVFGNVLYGHTHTIQSHVNNNPYAPQGMHKAESIGCLCDRQPEYMVKKVGVKNKWQHGFNVSFVDRDSGQFNDFTITIIDGSFIYNGVMYYE